MTADTGKTLRQMTAEIRANNIEKGWRPAGGGPGDNTWGDYLALLHSEVSEALEAYRDHRLADATRPICGNESHTGNPCPEHGMGKPEGVGSEFADILIRLLDMGDVFDIPVFDQERTISDVLPLHLPRSAGTFGGGMTWLHQLIAAVPAERDCIVPGALFPALPKVLYGLVTVAELYGVDLMAEYERKIAFNRTRPFQHGGRTLAARQQELPGGEG